MVLVFIFINFRDILARKDHREKEEQRYSTKRNENDQPG
jgi:hypothetical protein